jgi:hypothetical protein
MYAIISTATKVREKNDSLHSSRCSVVRKIGVDGKNDSLYYIQKRKKELKKNDSFKQIR